MTPKQWTPNHIVPCVLIDNNDVCSGSATKPQSSLPQAAVINTSTKAQNYSISFKELCANSRYSNFTWAKEGQLNKLKTEEYFAFHKTYTELSCIYFYTSPSETDTLTSTDSCCTSLHMQHCSMCFNTCLFHSKCSYYTYPYKLL